MDHLSSRLAFGHPQSPQVETVVRKICDRFHPETIYLYNQKFSAAGDSTAFKLCLVGKFADKNKVEQGIYREIDSEIPFDVILYTCEEWESISKDADSFASKIALTGTILYG